MCTNWGASISISYGEPANSQNDTSKREILKGCDKATDRIDNEDECCEQVDNSVNGDIMSVFGHLWGRVRLIYRH